MRRNDIKEINLKLDAGYLSKTKLREKVRAFLSGFNLPNPQQVYGDIMYNISTEGHAVSLRTKKGIRLLYDPAVIDEYLKNLEGEFNGLKKV